MLGAHRFRDEPHEMVQFASPGASAPSEGRQPPHTVTCGAADLGPLLSVRSELSGVMRKGRELHRREGTSMSAARLSQGGPDGLGKGRRSADGEALWQLDGAAGRGAEASPEAGLEGGGTPLKD